MKNIENHFPSNFQLVITPKQRHISFFLPFLFCYLQTINLKETLKIYLKRSSKINILTLSYDFLFGSRMVTKALHYSYHIPPLIYQ